MEALLSSRPPQYDGQDHRATWGREFPLEGQGTLLFTLNRSTPFDIYISPQKPANPNLTPGYLGLQICQDGALFVLSKPSKHFDFSDEKILDSTSNFEDGYVPDCITTYWLSIDHSNLVIKYGKGYVMEKTTLLTYRFIPEDASEDKKEEIRKEMSFIFGPTVKKVVMLYDIVPQPLLVQLYSDLASGKCAAKLTPELKKALYKIGTKDKLKIVEALIPRGEALTSEEENKWQGILEVEKKVDFYNFPLVSDFSPFVLDSSKVTLFSLDEKNKYTFSASLPADCVELYSNVKNTDLNYSPEPEKYKLSDAIRYSLNTPGCLLYDKIKEKQEDDGGFAKDQVYLRVTLGLQHGQSPGVPYVLEIWPKGCGSPIHNHGNTYAVIKVLHGKLKIRIYNKDLKSEQELKHFDVQKNDVTWISPNWYQTHKLWNCECFDDYCATIQCYQYGATNKTSWPYFDYLSTTDQIDEFLPDSDFGFEEMRAIVMQQYSDHMESQSK